MNIYAELNKVVEYIENNLEEDINYKDLSKMIGLNDYTFQKVFSLICDISISEYIRNRRLTNAGQELVLDNVKVTDVAIKYQYNNSTAFSRAFEKFHGIKPSEVKRNPEKLKMYTKLHFDEINNQSENIEYKIVEKEQMILYGIYKLTTNNQINIDAPKLYNEATNIYGEPPYGITEYKDKERRYVKSYWVLYTKKYNNMQEKIIPKSKWILIKINSQNSKDIQEASNKFYTKFLPSCKYNFRDLPEVEYYHDGITEFLIPIQN